jgi:DNA gyrase inhibitor GyrI
MDEPFCIATTRPMVVACLKFSGDARQVSQAFIEVAEWLRLRELRTSAWIGVYDDAGDGETYVDPDTREMHGEVRIPFEGSARGDGRIEVRRWEPQLVAVCIHHGDTSDIGDTVRITRRWARARGMRLASQHHQLYLKAVPGKPEESETEVQIPLLVRPIDD